MAAVRAFFVPVLYAVVALTVTTRRPCVRADNLEDVDVFVQSVLAVADRAALGLPDSTSADVPRWNGPVANGQLPPDLQRYLESLVSVSSAADRQTLVAMLWDDSLVVDEDQEPHSVFDRYRGNEGHNTAAEADGRR